MRSSLGRSQKVGFDQLQMHVVGNDGTYRIRTVCFDKDGRLGAGRRGRGCHGLGGADVWDR